MNFSPRNKSLGYNWSFKRKLKVDGSIDKFKTRIVVKDYKQNEEFDYFDYTVNSICCYK